MLQLRRSASLAFSLGLIALAGCNSHGRADDLSWLQGDGSLYEESYNGSGRPSIRLLIRRTGYEFLLEANGAVELSDDDREFRLSESGQSISVRERNGDDERVWSQSQGWAPSWTVNGHPAPIDAQASEWLAAHVLEIARTTPIGAKARAERFLRQGGVDALLTEFRQLRNAKAQSIYLARVVAMENVAPDELVEAVEACQQSRLTSSSRFEFYRKVAKAGANDVALTRVLLESLSSLSSSSQKCRVLRSLIGPSAVDAELSERWLAAAGELSSSSERTELLLEVLPALPADDGIHAQWLECARGVSSTSSRERLYSALAAQPECSAVTLRELTRRLSEEPLASSTQARVLGAVLENPKVDPAILTSVIAAALTISSSNDSASALIAAIQHPAADRSVLEALATATEGLSTTHARDRVRAALVQRLLAAPPIEK